MVQGLALDIPRSLTFCLNGSHRTCQGNFKDVPAATSVDLKKWNNLD